jgi:hypothetical protein
MANHSRLAHVQKRFPHISPLPSAAINVNGQEMDVGRPMCSCGLHEVIPDDSYAHECLWAQLSAPSHS